MEESISFHFSISPFNDPGYNFIFRNNSIVVIYIRSHARHNHLPLFPFRVYQNYPHPVTCQRTRIWGSNPLPHILFLKKRVKLSNWVSLTHSSKSTLGSLFLKLHEIFIPWTFVRIHTIHWNPLPFPRVEPGWAWHFFNQRYTGSRDHLGFNVFTICTKMVYAHLRYPIWM